MKTHPLILILILCCTWPAFGQERTGALTGSVVDAETFEALIGVNVFIKNTTTGVATDADGFFTLDGLTPGVYNIVAQYVGYETKPIPDVVIGSNRTVELTIQLNPATILGDEITVSSGYFSETGTSGIGKVSFSAEELRRSPGAGQELGRVINALPSVASRGEVSQDLLVRGGSPSENGYFIDNIPLPDVRHFRTQAGQSNGPIGVVNTELVSDLDFIAGGFSSKFGEKMSSISDITYRDGNRTRLRGDVGLNLAGFNVNMDGPVNAAKTTSVLFSVRRSYLDLIADAINAGGAPAFGDAQAKVTFNPNADNKIIVLNIFGSSLFESSLDDAREEGFADAARLQNDQNTTGINWRRLWNNGYTNTSLTYSYRRQTELLRDVTTEEASIDFGTDEQMATLRSVSFYRFANSSTLEFGLESMFERSDFDYFIASEVNEFGETRPDFNRNDDVTGVITSVFADYSLRPLSRWSITLGGRVHHNSFNDDINVAPRLKTRYELTPRLGANFSTGIFYQALPRFLISQNDNLANLRSTRSNHFIGGLDYLLTSDTKLSVEVFEKQYFNAPILPENNDLNDRRYVLDAFGSFYDVLEDNGRAWSRGVEILLQKKLAVNFYGMVSGSYFRTRYRDFSGDWQNRDFDNQFLFNVLGGYRPNDIWEMSIRWTILGGRPFTPVDPVASLQQGTQILDETRFNDDRLPAFHSLYVRVDRRFFLNRTNIVGFVEIWNAYNRANVDQQFWNVTNQQVDEATQFSLLPVGGFKFEF
ncbi:MAG: TonB-dependent receptor [Bacteroidota bacterium]